MMNVRVGRLAAIATVSAAVLMVCAGTAVASAQSPSALTPGGPYTVWSYGALRTVSFHGTSANGWVYQGSATYGYAVVLTQTNLTSDSFELAANRTMGAALSVQYCLLTCAGSKEVAQISYRAWEAADEWANFTTAGTVYEDAAPVSAIALNNSHSTVAGSLFDSAKGPQRFALLAVNVSSTAQVQFASPLGLLPENLSSGAQWNDSSDFSASGSYSIGLHYLRSGPVLGNLTVGPASAQGSLTGTGSVSVLGSVDPSTVNFGGVPYQNLSITVVGPFSVREGFILVPSAIDLFGGGTSATANATGASTVRMTSVYARPFIGGHLGIVGSEWMFAASTLNPTVASTAPTSSSSGINEIASGADTVGSTPVQGVPMAVDQSQAVQNCLVTGDGCPTSTTHSFLGLLIVGGAALTIALIAMVVVVERRRVPPPPRSNAGLYPPVVTMPGANSPPASGPNPPPPPPPEEDPLSHLW